MSRQISISVNHYNIEKYSERITTKQWKAMLLNDEDTIIAKGNVRKLKGKNLGSGVIEIYKAPMEE